MAKKSTADPMKEKVMGIDYGTENIGVAFGINGLVMPISIISGQKDESAINEIARYIIENKINKIIIGLPLNEEGKETNFCRVIRRFSKLLKARVKKPLEFENEYRTTADSKTEAISLGISKKRRQTVDHLSAALILKAYYNRLA